MSIVTLLPVLGDVSAPVNYTSGAGAECAFLKPFFVAIFSRALHLGLNLRFDEDFFLFYLVFPGCPPISIYCYITT